MKKCKGFAHIFILVIITILITVLVIYVSRFRIRNNNYALEKTSNFSDVKNFEHNYEVTKRPFFKIPHGHKFLNIIYTRDLEKYAYVNFIMGDELKADDDIYEVYLNGERVGKEYDYVMDIKFMNEKLVFHTLNYTGSRYTQRGYERDYNALTDEMYLNIVDLQTGQLTRIPAVQNFIISEDGSVLAYSYANKENKSYMFVIGENSEGTSYRKINDITLSLDGKNYKYFAETIDEEGNEIAGTVVNGQFYSQGSETEQINIDILNSLMKTTPGLSKIQSIKDKRTATIHGNKGDYYISLDGEPQPHYVNIWDMQFNNSGSILSYRAKKANGKVIVVLNDWISNEYDAAQYPRFCENTENFYFKASFYKSSVDQEQRDTTETMIVNGFQHEEYDAIYGGDFSEDCTEQRFLAREEDNINLIVTKLEDLQLNDN